MGRPVTFARCGTHEQWEICKSQYTNTYHVMPATVYVGEEGICLITSQEWVDWLTGKIEDIPNNKMNIGENYD